MNMIYPELSPELLDKLDELGFEGTDINLATSLFEYGGLYSKPLQTALLCEVDEKDPGISFQHITEAEIIQEVKRAGPGYPSFIDAEHCGLIQEPMGNIQSLMLWNGGWHIDSPLWLKLSDWTYPEMIRHLEEIANNTTKTP